MLGLSAAAWAVVVGIVFFGAVLQSTVGFGMGLVSAPVVVLVDPSLVPGVIIGMSVPLALLIGFRNRHDIDFSVVRWAIIGRFPGAILGGWAVAVLGDREIAIAFAVSLLLAVGLSMLGLSVVPTDRSLFGAGFVAGAMGTATSVGGPAMALVLQHQTGPEVRAAMAAFMVFGSTVSLALLALVGEFGGRELSMMGVLVPVILAGFVASRWTTGLLDGGHTRRAVLTFAAVAAVTILLRSL